MNIKHLIYGMTAALAIVACSAGDDQQGDSAPLPIRFTASVDGADITRAAATTSLKGYTFYVWSDMVNNKTSEVTTYLNAWEQNVDGNGNIVHEQKLFPVYNTLSFYAIFGQFEESVYGGSTLWPSVLNASVKTTQVSQDEYQRSDLLYAVRPDVSPTGDAVDLHFYHLFSKVEVALMARNNITAEEVLTQDATRVTVSIVGTRTKAEFRPSKTAELTTVEGRQALLTVPVNDDNAPQDITMETVTTDDFTDGTCAAAIVVPQTVDGRFIRLSYMGHDTYYSVSNLELKSGYRYRFNLTVDRIGQEFVVTPSLTVAPWGADTDVPADLNTLTGTTPNN